MKHQSRSKVLPITMEIKGSVFIIHGMGEYSKRYEKISNYLNKNGYKVIMIDHVGHGKNIVNRAQLGFIEDNFKKSIEELIEEIKKIRDGKPLFILGHSMGSFMTQILLEKGIKNDGIILSGSTRPNKVIIKFAYILSSILLIFGNNRNKILNNLLFGRNNIKFLGDQEFRWLSNDIESVKEYKEDSLCGFIPYTSYFKGLFYLIGESLKVGDKKKYKDTPLYIYIQVLRIQ